METVVVKGGKFTATLSSADLGKGLRTSQRSARNNDFLVTCKGAVGIDNVLSALESMTPIDTSVITDSFPFPQLFVFTNFIIVCGQKKIYEWNGSTLTLKYTATTVSGMWSAVDFFDYILLSNGVETVERSAEDKTYSLSTTLPTAYSMCNYNGQIMLGAPDVGGQGVSLTIVSDELTLTGSVSGSIATT